MRCFVVIMSVLTLLSCSESYKIRRAKSKIHRLAMKYPELKTTDTTYVIDTTIIDGTSVEDRFPLVFNDTIRLTDTTTNTTVKTYIDTIADTVYQSVESPPDTVITEVEVPCDTINATKEELTAFEIFKEWAWLLMIVVVVFLIAGKLLKTFAF